MPPPLDPYHLAAWLMGWLNLHPTMYLTKGLEIRPPVQSLTFLTSLTSLDRWACHDGISGTNVMGLKILLSDIFYVLNVSI